MNVWIVNQFVRHPSSPGGTRHWSLARGLARRGVSVSLIGSTASAGLGSVSYGTSSNCPSDVRLTMLDVDRFTIPGSKGKRIGEMMAFAWALRSHLRGRSDRPDVIFGSSPTLLAALVCAREARRRRIPFILEVRDIWPQTLIDLGGYSKWHPGVLVFGAIERHLYGAADHVVSLLPGAAKHIAARGGSTARVTHIPNGIDLELLGSDPDFIPPSMQEADVPFRVVYAGAHGLANALDAIIDAAKILEREVPGRFQFEFLGDGHEKNELVQRVNRLGIGSVQFHPPVPKSSVYARLRQADALVVNMHKGALYRFGISFNKLFDYLSVGRPVVFGSAASNDPVRESGGGISVEANNARAMADALLELHEMSPVERARFGEAGQQFVRDHHDFRILVDRLHDVLNTVVSKGHRD